VEKSAGKEANGDHWAISTWTQAVLDGRKKDGSTFSFARRPNEPAFASPDQQPKRPQAVAQPASSVATELQGIMANFARPVASSIAGIDFTVYNSEDVKATSVKRIHNTPTLDSFNNPVPGGLYDPAMGAWGDHV
jgi:DNA-directed RNA polymerase I subunit RPA1